MTRAMKDSGIEWIGQIPENWKISKLFYQLDAVGSGTTPQGEEYYDGNIPWLNTGDLTDGNVEYAKKTIDSKAMKDYSTLKLYPKDSIVIAMYGATIGKLGILKTQMTTNQACCVMSVSHKNYHKFIFYNFYAGKTYLLSTAAGAGQPNINQNIVKSFIIPLPPLSEQKKIADYLDKRCEKIDTAIDNQKQIIEKLKEYKQSLITETVTKGLNPNAKMKDSGIEWIGSIPEHWEIRKLSRLFKERKCKNTGMKEHNVLSLSYGKIKKRDIENNMGLLPESFETYNIVIPGNIVLRLTDLQNDHRSLRTGLVKEVGIITSAYITLEKIMDIDEDYYHKLLYTFDIMKGFYNMGDGVRQSLKFNELNKLLLPQPPLSEQKEIAEYLDKKCIKIDAAIKQKEETISKLEEYKKSLIFECVTGKKEVA